MKLKWFALLLAGMISAANAAQAFTLPTGTFKMQWMPDGPAGGAYGGSISIIMEDGSNDPFKGVKLPKLVSRRALMSTGFGYAAILDESYGTNTGYDTLYLKGGVVQSGFDMRDAAKVKLILGQNKDMVPAGPEAIYVPYVTGPAGQMVTRKSCVKNISVQFQPNKETWPNVRCVISLATPGGWAANIGTESAPVWARLSDTNGNGKYSDRFKNDGSYSDSVEFCAIPDPANPDLRAGWTANLGRVDLIDNQFYRIDVSSKGDAITINPYTGKSRAVDVQILDGSGEPWEGKLFINIAGPDCSFTFDDLTKRSVTLPDGDYNECWAVARWSSEKYFLSQIGIMVRRKFTISESATNKIVIGGPIRLKIIASNSSVKPGQKTLLKFDLKAGQDMAGGMQDEMPLRKITMLVLNPQGKTVLQAQAAVPWGWWSLAEYNLNIPKTWKPGQYSVLAKYNTAPFGRLVVAKTVLNVVK